MISLSLAICKFSWVVCLSLLLGFSFSGAMGQIPGKISEKVSKSKISGHWNFNFATERGLWFESLADIAFKSDNHLVAAILGKTWIKFTSGIINREDITLSGKSQYGDVKIEAKFVRDELAGHWSIGSQNGTFRATRPISVKSSISSVKVFDFVLATLDKQFYDPLFNGIDWKSVGEKYRRQAAQAKSEAELVNLVRGMLELLRTSHLEFYCEPPSVSAALNKTKKEPAPAPVTKPEAPVVWKKLSDQIGYLQIKRFEEGKGSVELIDRAFADLENSSSLIIDMRGNEGGTLSIGMRLGDYIFDEMRTLGYLATRKGLDRLKVKSISEINPADLPVYTDYNVNGFLEKLEQTGIVLLKTGGRVKNPYRGRIVVLINERSGSSTEAFAGAIKESRRATLIGQRTAGAMLSSTKVNVPGGWTLLLPEADFVTAGGTRIEGKGVEPDILSQTEKSVDAPLKRAVELIEEN